MAANNREQSKQIWSRLGHGAPYVVNVKVSSFRDKIESDHIPPVNIWSFVDDTTREMLPQKLRDVCSVITDWQARRNNRSEEVPPIVKQSMGTISVPSDIHRKFPTTGKNGYDTDIINLKAATLKMTLYVLNQKIDAWKGLIDQYIDDGTLIPPTNKNTRVPKSNKNYYKLAWKQNFKNMLEGSQLAENKKPIMKNMYNLHLASCKKFMAESIYYLKTKGGLRKLIELHVKEYKLYLGDKYTKYRLGFTQLLLTHVNFGWIDADDFASVTRGLRLPNTIQKIAKGLENANASWKTKAVEIEKRVGRSKNQFIRKNEESECQSNNLFVTCEHEIKIWCCCSVHFYTMIGSHLDKLKQDKLPT